MKLNKQKINEKVFKVKLTHNLKKCSNRELDLTALCVQIELQRRYGKDKK